MGPPKHSQGTTQVSKKLNWKIAKHSKFHYANSRRKDECGDWIRWSDDAHYAVRPCQVDCHKDWQPQWESGFAYVYIYIHMHNVHNKSAPCLFQIVTAFSKSAKHFGKERKKQHINNIHCEGPPPTVQVSQSRNMGVTKVWALPCSKPGLSGGYLYNLWYNISIYIATSTSTSISIFIFIFISI